MIRYNYNFLLITFCLGLQRYWKLHLRYIKNYCLLLTTYASSKYHSFFWKEYVLFLLASFYCWNKFSFFINKKTSLIPNPTSFSTEVPIFINSFMYHLTVVLIHRLCKQRSTTDYSYFCLITYYNHIPIRLFLV